MLWGGRAGRASCNLWGLGSDGGSWRFAFGKQLFSISRLNIKFIGITLLIEKPDAAKEAQERDLMNRGYMCHVMKPSPLRSAKRISKLHFAAAGRLSLL